MSVNQISNCPASQKPFCAQVYISNSRANLVFIYIKQKLVKFGFDALAARN
jgi:hypothetical protein